MTEHHAVVRLDYDYINALRARGVTLTQDHWDDAWSCYFTCSAPHNCPGWQECPESHVGMDPEDEDSPAYDQWEGITIHGQAHDWTDGHGWAVAADDCPVLSQPSLDRPDGVAPDRYGTYLLDADWDDTTCYLTVIREVTSE